MNIRVFRGLYWGPPNLASYHNSNKRATLLDTFAVRLLPKAELFTGYLRKHAIQKQVINHIPL